MNMNSSDNGCRPNSTSIKIKPVINKNTRLPYTFEEDSKIVKYIVDKKLAFDVFGNQMWKTMERANICRIRTWQSMRERYLKQIKFKLKAGSHRFLFLSADDLKLLRKGLKIYESTKDVKK